MSETPNIHYHISFGTFRVVDGEDTYVRESEPQTAVDKYKARRFAADFIYALSSAWNAVQDDNVFPSLSIEWDGTRGPGEILIEYRLEFPDGWVEKTKVTACDSELIEDDGPEEFIIIDGDMEKLLESLGIGTSVPNKTIYH